MYCGAIWEVKSMGYVCRVIKAEGIAEKICPSSINKLMYFKCMHVVSL
jgi:hypothetical protein